MPSLLQGLEQKLERDFHTGLFSWDEVHLNDASDLLKRFIRELPAPLLTAEYLPAFAVVPSEQPCPLRLGGELHAAWGGKVVGEWDYLIPA